MIYLIDDKKTRQEKDYNWSCEKFEKYKEYIHPIYSLNDLQKHSEEVFKAGNTILYHESFIDNTSIRTEAAIRRNKLNDFVKNENAYLVLFSGSKNTIDITDNVANMPVSVLYRNLNIFIDHAGRGDINLKHLAFGANIQIEKELSDKLESAWRNTLSEKVDGLCISKNLFIRPSKNNIISPLNNCIEKTIFNKVTDEDFSKNIEEWLNEEVYENIFIPLCFGSTLSDFNGLRFACHIRCTKTINQNSRIYIYSFVGIEYILQNEYFDILKTKNTYLIPFSKKAISDSSRKPQDALLIEELSEQIAKLHLSVPQNYEDNHSIANEWAIYRWANTIDAEDESIDKIKNSFKTNLYFKYLQTTFPIDESQKLTALDLKIPTDTKPRILYIDDEAEKGWYEVFCKILYDINKLDFDYIGDDFKNQSVTEIVDSSILKVKEFDADIVILDFRLHQSDFEQKNINDVTGVKVLKLIKEYNPGIQVVVFSATNKVWNLQALQQAGANGFIIKESPQNSIDVNFTKSTILGFLKQIVYSLDLRFLKFFFINQKEVVENLRLRRNLQHKHPLPKEFVNEVIKWLESSNYVLNSNYLNDNSIVSSFLFKFSVLENIANRIIDIDNPIEVNKNETKEKKYKFQFRTSNKCLNNFYEDKNKNGYYIKSKREYISNRNIPWNIKILNTIDFVSNETLCEDKLNECIRKRNDIIHANSTTGDSVKISIDNLIFLNEIIILGLKNVI